MDRNSTLYNVSRLCLFLVVLTPLTASCGLNQVFQPNYLTKPLVIRSTWSTWMMPEPLSTFFEQSFEFVVVIISHNGGLGLRDNTTVYVRIPKDSTSLLHIW